MRSRLRNLTRTQALVAVVGLLLALAWAAPSLGAGVGKVARLALGRANEAFHNADLAINTSDTAKRTANDASGAAASAGTAASAARSAATTAQTAAGAAQSAANGAQSTANAAQLNAFNAQSTANQALTKANGIVSSSFGRLNQPCAVSQTCSVDHARGITSIRQTATPGNYCVSALGRSPSGVGAASWLVSVDAGDLGAITVPQALPDSSLAGCASTEFGVQVTVGSGNANEVGFFVVIP